MLHRLNDIFPIRYTVFGLCIMGLILCIFTLVGFGQGGWLALDSSRPVLPRR